MRPLMQGIICAAVGVAAVRGGGAGFAARPIHVIVGFGPGSGADITARVVGARMSQLLGQQIVVENKAGAGSSLAAEAVARAPKDGYTLLMATISQPINAAVVPNLTFDFVKDFAPIALVSTTPMLLVAHPSVGGREERQGADRARQGKARRAVVRLLRGRDRHASLGRAAQGAHRHQDRARSLRRKRPGGDRSASRAHPYAVLAGVDRDPAPARRQTRL